MPSSEEITHLDFAEVSPQDFSALIANTSKSDLEKLGASESRRGVLDEIFRRMAADFRPERAGKSSAVIHWVIGDRADGGEDVVQTVIADGTHRVSDNADDEPRVTLKAGFVNFLKLVSGNANGMTMFMTRKLRVEGDLGFATNLMNLFNIPKA